MLWHALCNRYRQESEDRDMDKIFNTMDLVRLVVVLILMSVVYNSIGYNNYKPNEAAIVDYTRGIH